MGVEHVGDVGDVSPSLLIKCKLFPMLFWGKCIVHVSMGRCE